MSFDQIQVELQETMGSDRSIAECAWTSSTTHKGQLKKTDEQVADLVKRLAKEGHATPFEAVVFRFWLKIPIFVDRQHMTHRIASHNGMSGRYRTMPSEYYKMPEDCVDILSKMAWVDDKDLLVGGGRIWQDYAHICNKAMLLYENAISKLKIAKADEVITDSEYKRMREVLRGMCPQSGMTERVTTMNLRSFANYQKLRNSEHAQPEIAYVASLMLDAVNASGVAPIAIAELLNNGWTI